MTLRVESNTNIGYTNYSNNYTNRVNERLTFFDYQQDKNSEKRAKTACARYKAIQDKSLVYYPEKTDTTYILFFIKQVNHQPAYYEYTANGKETVYKIKQKLGIQDYALEKFNKSYKESEDTDACIPSAGTKLRFYETDVE